MQGPAEEIKVQDVTTMEALRAFLAQYGEGHRFEDSEQQEQEFQAMDPGAWARAELVRINDNKFRPSEGAKCDVCFTTKSDLYPEGQPSDVRCHKHISSRLHMLSCASSYGQAGCVSGCVEKVHLVRTGLRRKVLLTASSLNDCFTEGKDAAFGYRGLADHVDIIAIPGGRLQELVHAFLVEIRGSSEPVDLAIYGGINDVIQAKIETRGGFFFVKEESMVEVLQSLAVLGKELLTNPVGHTMRCALIALPPLISKRGPGFEEAWKQVNQAFRICNERWQELGLSWHRHLNMRDFARHTLHGRRVPSYKAYREMLHSQKLHFIPKVKLTAGIRIARALGARTVPENYIPPQYP